MELLGGTMLRHSLIVYRDDATEYPMPTYEGDDWLNYIPIRLPETFCVEEKLPLSAAGVLINQNHSDKDIYLNINAAEKRMLEANEGKHTIRNS
jgi:hypothetical protein